MTRFRVPQPILTDKGRPALELDGQSLFTRVIGHVARQWPDHDIVGNPLAVMVRAWNDATTQARRAVLDGLTEALFLLAMEDQLTIIGMGKVLLLPLGNQVPPDEGLLSRLTEVTPETTLPLSTQEEHNVRVLYRRAHVIAPYTAGA